MCLFPYDTVNSSFYIALFARHLDVFWHAHWNSSRCLAKIAIYNEDSTVSEGVSFRSPAWPEHKGHIKVDLSWRLCISKAHLAGVTNTHAEGVAFLTPAGVLCWCRACSSSLCSTVSCALVMQHACKAIHLVYVDLHLYAGDICWLE